MKELLQKALAYIKLYKWLFIPAVPLLLLFILIIVLLFFPQSPTSSPKDFISPTPTVNPQEAFIDEYGNEIQPDPPEYAEIAESTEVQIQYKKEAVNPDGSIVYTYPTDNPSRQGIIITDEKGVFLFAREVDSPERDLTTVSVYKESYGNPEKVVNGSKFYGQQAATYVFAKIGLAVIADIKTGLVYEKHNFTAMSADEYLKKYGKDN